MSILLAGGSGAGALLLLIMVDMVRVFACFLEPTLVLAAVEPIDTRFSVLEPLFAAKFAALSYAIFRLWVLRIVRFAGGAGGGIAKLRFSLGFGGTGCR